MSTYNKSIVKEPDKILQLFIILINFMKKVRTYAIIFSYQLLCHFLLVFALKDVLNKEDIASPQTS